MSNKAWAVYHDDVELVTIYQAATRGKAIAAALHSAREAGYKAQWGDFKAKRAACYDSLVQPNAECFPLGHHARSYDLRGDFTGYDQFGCLEGQRQRPSSLYASIGKEAGR
jgi:hypothetical protein